MDCDQCEDGDRLRKPFEMCYICSRTNVRGRGSHDAIVKSKAKPATMARHQDRLVGLERLKRGLKTMNNSVLGTDYIDAKGDDGLSLRDHILKFKLHTPGLNDQQRKEVGPSVLEVMEVIVREHMLARAYSNPSSLLVYRKQIIVTAKATKDILESVLEASNQNPSQLRARHYEPTNAGEGGNPPLAVLAVQATGSGGLWDWAEQDDYRQDTALPMERLPALLCVPRNDPPADPIEGSYGVIVCSTVAIAGSMVKARRYKDAGPDTEIQGLVKTKPAYVRPNPKAKGPF